MAPRPDQTTPDAERPSNPLPVPAPLGPVTPGWSSGTSDGGGIDGLHAGSSTDTPTPSDAERALRDATRGERLQKVLSSAGIGSRRACEALIEEGKVIVNGTVVSTLPAWADPRLDRIEVDGRRIHGPAAAVNVMLYKPRGVVCTNDDPEGRRCAIDLVQHPSRARMFTVGRLDIDSSGLLLLTNDGAMAQRLVHPSHNIEKRYEVLVRGYLSDESIATLLKGVFLMDPDGEGDGRAHHHGSAPKPRRARVKHVDIKMRDNTRTRFEVILGEGRNRQIRRMTAALGHPVKRLKRLAIGPLKLKGLRPGQWRDLDREELRRLRRAAHLKD